MFIVHNSAGHGINLQAGGSHICWYTLPWDLEGFVQTNGRVDRQGQTRACYAHHIVAVDTIDQRVSEALAFKDAEQADIIAAIRSV
jgi:SNF2 family DNA or RNA helicase